MAFTVDEISMGWFRFTQVLTQSAVLCKQWGLYILYKRVILINSLTPRISSLAATQFLVE